MYQDVDTLMHTLDGMSQMQSIQAFGAASGGAEGQGAGSDGLGVGVDG